MYLTLNITGLAFCLLRAEV